MVNPYAALEDIPPAILRGWQAHFATSPPIEYRAEQYHRQLMCLMANANRGKRDQARRPDQFALWRDAGERARRNAPPDSQRFKSTMDLLAMHQGIEGSGPQPPTAIKRFSWDD